MKYQDFLTKQLGYSETLSAPELSQNITEAAFNSSSLLMEIGQEYAENTSYRNVYVSHPTISEVTEGQPIPASTVQSYSTTASSWTKIASSIELSNEVINFSKFDVQANTASLVGVVTANKIAELVVTDINSRFTNIPIPFTTEDVFEYRSGIADKWGTDSLDTYAFIATSIKDIPDTYDRNAKLYCSKSNFIDFASAVQNTAEGSDQVWLVQNGLLLGRYEIVICDQIGESTMYFGDLQNAFDLVALPGNQTVDPVTKPDVLKITDTSQYAIVAKDTRALVAMSQAV